MTGRALLNGSGPAGKVLTSIKVLGDPGTTIHVTQSGADGLHTADCDSTWRTYATGRATASGDRVTVQIHSPSSESRVMDANFEEIVLGD